MNDNEDQSPYGRGFVAACIVVAAVLLCGALLLITGLTSPPTNATAGTTTTQPVQASSADSGTTATTSESGPDSTSQPATQAAEPGSTTTGSGTPGANATGPNGTGSGANEQSAASGCTLPAGDQATPTKPPAVDGWDVSRRVVVPRSTTYGPAKTDPDGFRHCFAHSPTGAVYAAYNAVAALADQRQAVSTVQKLMLPGPDTDALIRKLRTEDPSGSSTATQLAGFRVLDANEDRATIMLALPVESAYMSITLTFAWHHNDWHLRPPPPGAPVGTPFAQHRDLTDFVTWSGV